MNKKVHEVEYDQQEPIKIMLTLDLMDVPHTFNEDETKLHMTFPVAVGDDELLRVFVNEHFDDETFGVIAFRALEDTFRKVQAVKIFHDRLRKY